MASRANAEENGAHLRRIGGLSRYVIQIVAVVAAATFFFLLSLKQEQTETLIEVVGFFEAWLCWLLIAILLGIAAGYIYAFIREKRVDPGKRLIELLYEKTVSLFFIAITSILLIDAGLKMVKQIVAKSIEVEDIFGLLIISITAVMLLSLHRVFILLIPAPSIVEEEEKKKAFTKGSSISIIILLFATTASLATLVILRYVIFAR